MVTLGSPASLVAYLNHGRWVADCECRAGILVDRGGGLYGCRECRTFWLIEVPIDAAEIDRVVSMRPLRNRNWLPGETVGDLMVENVAHGIAPDWALKAADK